MDLQLKPFHKNTFPLGGILVRGASVSTWVKEIQFLQLDLTHIQVYPIPDTSANSVWGCLIVTSANIDKQHLGRNAVCQMVSPHLYIPEHSILFPAITPAELQKLFPDSRHIFHPEFGLVELAEEIDFQEYIDVPTERPLLVTKPEATVYIPSEIRSFQVIALPPEAMLQNMEEKLFPQPETMKDKPLTVVEKRKLGLYSLFFTAQRQAAGDTTIEKTGLLRLFESLAEVFSHQKLTVTEKAQKDFEALERRNRSQLDKLMEMLRRNPEEALQYAIPLDDTGTSRGGTAARLDLSRRWFDFSLGGIGTQSGAGSVIIGDHFQELQKQYNATALEMIRKKQFHKAAFIYMKLLKNNHLAAQTLESGLLYQEAATIYLQHLGNKSKAAECYEKGNMTHEAIEIYKELQAYEKVGDLYLSLNKCKEAAIYFEKVAADYAEKGRFVQASLIYRYKMKDIAGGQALLLQGWKSLKDPFNCLNNYFNNCKDTKELKSEIDRIYATDLTKQNSAIFLQAIRHEYRKGNELSASIREMAYTIIAEHLPENPSIVSELREFNLQDSQIKKDTIRFTVYGKK